MADRYLMEDLVGFEGMDFLCWICMETVGISFGRIDFWLC